MFAAEMHQPRHAGTSTSELSAFAAGRRDPKKSRGVKPKLRIIASNCLFVEREVSHRNTPTQSGG
jgi:hypothetical protein